MRRVMITTWRATDTEAIGAGTDLSADANMPFSTDIDGGPRTPGAWDIGADQRAVAIHGQTAYTFLQR